MGAKINFENYSIWVGIQTLATDNDPWRSQNYTKKIGQMLPEKYLK